MTHYASSARRLFASIHGEAPRPLTAEYINTIAEDYGCDVEFSDGMRVGTVGDFCSSDRLIRVPGYDIRHSRHRIRIRPEMSEREDLFTRAHELGHLWQYLLRVSWDRKYPAATEPGDEVFCDWFARELILPVEIVKALPSLNHTNLHHLQERFKATDVVIFLQLMEADRISKLTGILGTYLICAECGGNKLPLSRCYVADNDIYECAYCQSCRKFRAEYRLKGKDASFFNYLPQLNPFWKQTVTNLPALQ